MCRATCRWCDRSKPHDRELRQIAVALEAAELLEPDVGAGGIGHAQVERRIRRVHQAFETGHGGVHLAAFSRPGRELAVTAHADPAAPGEVPDVALRRCREIAVVAANLAAALAQVRSAAIAIVGRPQLLDHVGRVGAHRERVAVITDLGIDIEVVEERERAGKRVRVGCDLLAEERERLVAVALRHVAEDLVVGPVLPDT